MALAVLPSLVAALAALTMEWVPASDHALEVLRISEVGTRYTPLVGAYSRMGWHHPGPLLFWASAPLYRLAGPEGVLASVGLLTAASAGLAVVAARRIGGHSLMWLAAVAAVVLQLSLGDHVVDPWNPYVPIVALLAYLLCTWRAAEGDGWLLLAAVATGSYCVQAHVGYAPVVLAGAGFALARAGARRRSGTPVPSYRWVAAAGLVGLALWSGPLLQSWGDNGGNLLHIWEERRSPDEPAVGWEEGLRLAGRQFGVPAPWMGAREMDPNGLARRGSPLAVAAILLAGIVLAAVLRRRGDAQRAWFIAYALALTGVAVWGLTRISGLPAPYLTRPCWSVAALLYVSVAWGVVGLVGSAAGARRAARAAAVAVTAASLAAAGIAASLEVPNTQHAVAVAALSEQIRDELDPSVEHSVTLLDQRDLGSVGTGVVVDLQRRGWKLYVAPAYAHPFRPWRTHPPDPLPRLVIISDPEAREWTPPPDGRRVAAVNGQLPQEPGNDYEAWLAPCRQRCRSGPGGSDVSYERHQTG
ncbi:MAG: hypothetical protein ACLFXM_01850 [Acidimicrobiia bacterium]